MGRIWTIEREKTRNENKISVAYTRKKGPTMEVWVVSRHFCTAFSGSALIMTTSQWLVILP
jgi:hypothetical protein